MIHPVEQLKASSGAYKLSKQGFLKDCIQRVR
jgi:hypothetical protein